jgi:hypothetical protein
MTACAALALLDMHSLERKRAAQGVCTASSVYVLMRGNCLSSKFCKAVAALPLPPGSAAVAKPAAYCESISIRDSPTTTAPSLPGAALRLPPPLS